MSDRTTDKDGTTMKLNLEGGVHLGNEETSLPGYIGCYAALYNENNILKCTKFFVRGSNREGRFLTADNDQIFVISASNQVSNAAPKEAEKKVKVVAKNGKRSKKTAKQKDSPGMQTPTESQTAAVAPVKELSSIANAKPPEKPTTVYLAADAVLPLFLMHHMLPMFLAALAALSFVRARMVGFDIKGEEVASGSKTALIAGIIFSLLTLLCLVMQFAVFG